LQSAIDRCVVIETRQEHNGDSDDDGMIVTRHQGGTGVIVGKDLVLTNSHLLEPGWDIFVDGKMATVLKQSKEHDLALLSVETKRLPNIRFTETTASTQNVFYVGNPGDHQRAVLPGKIVKEDDHYVYTDCFDTVEEAFGASGSGLYTLDGHLIGLKRGMCRGENDDPPLSVAVPAKTIRDFMMVDK
jgi:S1-C subfamily serine protease